MPNQVGRAPLLPEALLGCDPGTTHISPFSPNSGVSPNWGYLLGEPMIRIIVIWGLYWGPPIVANYISWPCIPTYNPTVAFYGLPQVWVGVQDNRVISSY